MPVANLQSFEGSVVLVGHREPSVLEKMAKSTNPDSKKTIVSRLIALDRVPNGFSPVKCN